MNKIEARMKELSYVDVWICDRSGVSNYPYEVWATLYKRPNENLDFEEKSKVIIKAFKSISDAEELVSAFKVKPPSRA